MKEHFENVNGCLRQNAFKALSILLTLGLRFEIKCTYFEWQKAKDIDLCY